MVEIIRNGVKENYVKILDKNGKHVLSKDSITEATIFISYPHHELHEGDMFGVIKEVSLATAGDIGDIYIITPSNGKQMHIVWDISGDDKFKLQIYKNPTVSSNGTDITSEVFNHNQNSSNTTSATVYDSPTVTNAGTLLYCAYTDKFVSVRALNELILGENDTYLFRLIALKDSATICINGIWYEHTPNS